MNSIGIIGGADGPTTVLVSAEPNPWAVVFFFVTAVFSIASVVLGLVALGKAKKSCERKRRS